MFQRHKGEHSCLFSVIIPTHERPEFLTEAIASVLEQTVQDFECVVVDDGSRLPVAIPDDPRIVMVRRDDRGGHAAALNSGLRQARGRYVVFLDDDDLYMPDRLAMALEGHRVAPVAVCLRHGSSRPGRGYRVLEGDVSDTILDGPTPNLGQVSILSEITPLFDERFPASVDTEWWLRVAQAGTVTTVHREGFMHRAHEGPRMTHGVATRIECSRMLLELRADYFTSHPRAAAFRYKRIGLMASDLNQRAVARASFWRSLRLHPEARTLWHAARVLAIGPRVKGSLST